VAHIPIAKPDAPAIVSGAFSAFLSVGTPVVLIILRAVADSVLPAQDRLRAWVDFLGNPAIALPLGVGLMMLMYRRIGMDVLAGWISSASSRCGSIMIIVGAGGILGAVLQSSGLGDYLGQLMTGIHIPGLLVPFLLAMALKSTQGSSLVTMLTTAALVAPILPGLGISREIAVLATCAGSMAVVHVNDSFFWVVTRFADMDVPSGYRSLTLQTLVQSVVALAVTLALSMFM
jgi:GntP family gluconate:H+ symporter